jgi:hypothetical protein
MIPVSLPLIMFLYLLIMKSNDTKEVIMLKKIIEVHFLVQF